MANIGDQLLTPESGWQRIDDRDTHFTYTNMSAETSQNFYNGTYYAINILTNTVSSVEFYFYGTKLRLYDQLYSNRNQGTTITIDDSIVEPCSGYSTTNTSTGMYLYYEKTNLDKRIHHIKIEAPATADSSKSSFAMDCIDIDDDGYMCTEIQYEIQEAQNRKFPVMIGDSTITSEENIANYANTLTSGERQVLIMESGDMFLTDGQGGYKKINSSDSSSSGGTNTLSYFSNPNK